jgi:tetratricopeptide (TPR) repeat protein
LVWGDTKVGKFMGERFVSVRITVTDSVYREFSKKWGVRGTPTVLFLNAKGEEVDRIVGFSKEEKDAYVQKVMDFADGKNTLAAVLAEVEKNPDDIEANWKMAQKYGDRNEQNKAQSYYQKVVDLDPENSLGHSEEASYQIAYYEARYNRNAEPIKAFIASDPDEKYLFQSYMVLTSVYQRKDDTENVIAAYEEALKRMPDNARMMVDYANAIFTMQIESHYEKGLELNQKSVALDPEQELYSVFNLIAYYTNLKDTEKLVKTFEDAIQKWPENDTIKIIYAQNIVHSNIETQYDRAKDILNKLLEKNPEAPYQWYYMGLVLEREGEVEKAIEAVKKALEFRPDVKTYQNKLEELQKKLQE